jgi:mercuric ion transport protein
LNGMRDRGLITTGIVGAAVAAVCCATPLLVVAFGAVGLLPGLPRPIMC